MSPRGPTARQGHSREPAPTRDNLRHHRAAPTPAQIAGLRYCAQPPHVIRVTSVTGGAPTQATLASLFDRNLITEATRAALLTELGRVLHREYGS